MIEKCISLICTVKNEDKTIKELLESIFNQVRKPDEIIIVDGGSTDKTVDIVKGYSENNTRIDLIIAPGANISKGRNIAIERAKGNIIAVTDAGCILDSNWIKNIVKPFEEDSSVDVVSGWSEPIAQNDFELCVAELTSPKLYKVNKRKENFLPPSRSVAFKKECWERIGGYPEWLYTAEDTLLDLKLKSCNFKFSFAQDAVVNYRVRTNVKDVAKQYYLYGKGDGQAKLFINTYTVFCMIYLSGAILMLWGFFYPLAWIILIFCIISYIAPPMVRIQTKIKGKKNTYIVPFLIIVIDLSKIRGYLIGRTQALQKW